MKLAILAALALAALALVGSASAAVTSYSVYTYNATIASNVTVGSATFAAGDTVTGQIYALNGVPNTSSWIYVGETGVYVDAVKAFSFVHEDLAIVGGGAGGNIDISNNRRLVASGNPVVDAYSASIGLEGGANHFTETLVGGGVSQLDLSLSTNFLAPGNPALNAITGVGYPSSFNVGLFDHSRTVTINFGNSQSVVANIQSISVSTASAIPEPSSFAALAGLGVLGLAATRRRRAA